MLILGGTCGLLAGAAKCTGWFNDRCRALPDQDPFTAQARELYSAAVWRPGEGLSGVQPVHPRAAWSLRGTSENASGLLRWIAAFAQ
jgi:hypothetical protein